MDDIAKSMLNLANWDKKGIGTFIFFIAQNAFYEIVITYQDCENIKNAKAILFLAGCYETDEDGTEFFERELIHSGETVAHCAAKAIAHYANHFEKSSMDVAAELNEGGES